MAIDADDLLSLVLIGHLPRHRGDGGWWVGAQHLAPSEFGAYRAPAWN